MTQTALRELLNLVKEDRIRPASAGARNALIASESDKGRVVNSPSFRRLQQKAQVFPLDPNAAVRTRLTHSIEVSQVGRYLAQKVVEKLGPKQDSYSELAAFVNVVETACLLHDIGNPPFGHLGEAAIREWFVTRKKTQRNHSGSVDDSEDALADLQSFDGNPQGFRLISFLSGKDSHGLNLTCSLLLATVKYPWTRTSKPEGEKKIGLFDMDHQTYEEACGKLRWPAGKKFPFLRLMEAADDIAYSMSDLEDGLEKKIVQLEDLEKEFGSERFSLRSVYPMVSFKTNVTNEAVEAAAQTFAREISGVLQGEDVPLIPEDSEIGALLDKVNTFARQKIYQSPPAERIELAGRSVIVGLLRHYRALLGLKEDQFIGLMDGERTHSKDLPFQARLLRTLPPSYCEKYRVRERGAEADRRAHLIVDFIAGMTDDFALDTYQMLEGIRIQ